VKLDDRRNLERLQHDFGRIAPLLQQMAARVVREAISRYPVFVACRTPVELGVPVVMADALGIYWNFRLTTLEELLKRKLVAEANLADFRSRYEDAPHSACVLLVPPGQASPQVVFIPYSTPLDN
jgi:hypothetical protein